MTRPTEVPSWAHTIQSDGTTWRCSGSNASEAVTRDTFRRCDFTSSDLGEAMTHVTANQYDARHERPVDGKR